VISGAKAVALLALNDGAAVIPVFEMRSLTMATIFQAKPPEPIVFRTQR